MATTKITGTLIADASIDSQHFVTGSVDKVHLAADATPKVVQVQHTQSSAVATGTTTTPVDDTIPQITEGNEFLTVVIVPTNAANYLMIEAQLMLSTSAAGGFFTVAFFKDAGANAIATTTVYVPNNNAPITVSLRHRMLAGATASTTFRVRAGCNNAGTTTFNGNSGARLFGGVAASWITATEQLP